MRQNVNFCNIDFLEFLIGSFQQLNYLFSGKYFHTMAKMSTFAGMKQH